MQQVKHIEKRKIHNRYSIFKRESFTIDLAQRKEKDIHYLYQIEKRMIYNRYSISKRERFTIDIAYRKEKDTIDTSF